MDFDSTSLPPEEQQKVANPTSTAESHSDPRVEERLAIGTQVQSRWEEHKGIQRQIRVHVVDVRKSELWVQSERAIAGGTIVNLYTAGFVPMGRASVRECTTRGLDYSIRLYVPGRSMPDL